MTGAGSHAAAPASYRLGCPLWSFPAWRGQLYRSDSASGSFLQQYASVFDAVEGNTTFYAVPAPATIARWLAQVPEDFRFCFKLPRDITHEGRLRDGAAAARGFLDRLRPLGPRVGTVMIQLPAAFGPRSLPDLCALVEQLPDDFAYAVELRRRVFFEDAAVADETDALLRELALERVILDSRALYGGDRRHPDVLAAEHPKPDLPVRAQALTAAPLVRLITHPDAASTRPWLHWWADRLVAWLAAGLTPFLFVHCPNNVHSPGFARDLHDLVVAGAAARGLAVAALAHFPGEEGDEQLTLL